MDRWHGSSLVIWRYGYDASNSGLLNDLWKINSFQVLPVQLLQFNGLLHNDIATLQWKSSQEINFSHYMVERSYDGIHFTGIGQLNGKGNAANELTIPIMICRSQKQPKYIIVFN
jgi:hypothetical protein